MPKFQKIFRDKNHPEIVKKLVELGYKVIDLAAVGASVPDIIVADQHITALIEIKLPDGRFYLGQLEFLATWPGIAGFAQTYGDVLNLMEDPEYYRLQDEAKKAILRICARLRADEFRDQKQPRIAVRKFEKLFEAEMLDPAPVVTA